MPPIIACRCPHGKLLRRGSNGDRRGRCGRETKDCGSGGGSRGSSGAASKSKVSWRAGLDDMDERRQCVARQGVAGFADGRKRFVTAVSGLSGRVACAPMDTRREFVYVQGGRTPNETRLADRLTP